MIGIWGGWELFQELLAVLSQIGIKHKVSVSNVATRWVLDHDYVGAVIVGARMGISDHTAENLATYGWRLDEEDQAMIETVQKKSKRKELFVGMGDCAGEFRQSE
jgi:aryl-alcohol dehydrogenase-like predicted oxidoreductase